MATEPILDPRVELLAHTANGLRPVTRTQILRLVARGKVNLSARVLSRDQGATWETVAAVLGEEPAPIPFQVAVRPTAAHLPVAPSTTARATTTASATVRRRLQQLGVGIGLSALVAILIWFFYDQTVGQANRVARHEVAVQAEEEARRHADQERAAQLAAAQAAEAERRRREAERLAAAATAAAEVAAREAAARDAAARAEADQRRRKAEEAEQERLTREQAALVRDQTVTAWQQMTPIRTAIQALSRAAASRDFIALRAQLIRSRAIAQAVEFPPRADAASVSAIRDVAIYVVDLCTALDQALAKQQQIEDGALSSVASGAVSANQASGGNRDAAALLFMLSLAKTGQQVDDQQKLATAEVDAVLAGSGQRLNHLAEQVLAAYRHAQQTYCLTDAETGMWTTTPSQ